MIKEISITQNVLKQLNLLLSKTCGDDNSGKEEILWSCSQIVSDDRGVILEIDVKIVNSGDGPYIDAVLFENNKEVYCLEPSFEAVEGEYLFEHKGEIIGLKITNKD